MPKKKINDNNMRLTFNDEYNLEKVKELYTLSDDKLLKYTNHTEYTKEENKKYISKIKKSLKSIIINNKESKTIQYELYDCNRLFSKESDSLQYYSNDILHYILPQNSFECDMKNCNPQLLLWLYKKHNLDYKWIKYYCENRDKLLQKHNITKQYVIIQLNMDKPTCNKNIDWLDKLLKEVNYNKGKLYSLEEDKVSKKYKEEKKNSDNFLSSICSAIVWYYENQILMEATKLFKCIVPRFDGFITNDNIDMDKLNNITKNYGITWDKKYITQVIKIDNNNIDINDILYDINSNEYESIEYFFNKKHCKIINNGTYIRKNSEVEIELLTKKQMHECYCDIPYEVYNEKTNKYETKIFIDKWIVANPNMIKYRKMEIYPNIAECPKDIYNLWTKFEVETITEYDYVKEDLDYLLNHIKILCGNNEEVYTFVIKYLAHMFYRPEEKIGKMLLFCSKEGTGKGLFYKLLRNMIGSRFYSISDPQKNLLGNFNTSLLNSYVINFEELDWCSSKNSADILKNLITETELEINGKSKDGKIIKSVHRFIGNTNHTAIPFKISPTDRRFCIIRCSDEKIGDTEYFKRLINMIEGKNRKNIEATFYKYLGTVDITDFMYEKIPQTEYLESLKESFENPLIEFIKDLTIRNYHKNKNYLKYSVSNLFELFRNFIEQDNLKLDWSKPKFTRELNETIRTTNNLITKGKSGAIRYYILDMNQVNIKYDLQLDLNLQNEIIEL